MDRQFDHRILLMMVTWQSWATANGILFVCGNAFLEVLHYPQPLKKKAQLTYHQWITAMVFIWDAFQINLQCCTRRLCTEHRPYKDHQTVGLGETIQEVGPKNRKQELVVEKLLLFDSG